MVDARHSQIPTPIPPDYEDRHTLALALCEHLGINPQHVLLGSMQIELGPDHRHRITWTGHTHLNLNDLTALLVDPDTGQSLALPPNDNPDHNPATCRATYPSPTGHWDNPDTAHRCHLNAGHTSNHSCGLCATTWEPNQA